MPTKSNNMSPMPMQSKIGDASLKFGPDWLRAYTSSETTGNNANSSSPGGDAGSVGRGFGFSGWGGGTNSEARTGFTSSNNKEYSASSHFSSSSSSPSYHQQQHYQSPREGKGGTPPSSIGTRFKPSENRYSREEMLALYDKNLEAPSFLLNLGTLFIEKMQPPLAFSQPSEDEIRIWHSPQPESSRQGTGAAPIGRGYATRGRGGGIERGRGRGRGGYYARSHEEEERGGSFSRPRTYERSQSNIERAPWVERNGIGGPGGPPGTEEIRAGGGGNWRNRESFGGRRHDENDDGWRKPRWRRDEEEEAHRGSSGGRRLNRSFSEDENHDNIPEWARDNPIEESGTFDSSGEFHGEDRGSKSKDLDRKTENQSSGMKSSIESEPSGSQNDRVQKRNPDRNESVKPVIPAPVKEEAEAQGENNDYTPSSTNRISKKQYSSTQQHPGNSIIQQKNENDFNQEDSETENRDRITTGNIRQQQQSHQGQVGGVGSLESQLQQIKPQKQQITNVQHHISTTQETRTQMTHNHQSVTEQNANPVVHHQQQPSRINMRASNPLLENTLPGNVGHNRHTEEDHYRNMTDLVSKLVEEDGSMSRNLSAAAAAAAVAHGLRLPSNAIPQQLLSGVNVNVTNSLTNSMAMNSGNDISRNSGITPNVSAGNIPPATAAHAPSVSHGSLDVWFYRDPQGNVQGPFSTQEMGQWHSQGYFSGKLLLRRECDKIFITLGEMAKLYNRNPFAAHPESPPPPPIQDSNASALDFPRGDGNQHQAQLLQQRQQQLLQQNMLREQQQQQYMMNSLGHGVVRKEEPAWQGPNNISQISQPNRSTPNSSLTAEQLQTQQLLMNLAKSSPALERNSDAMDQITALFQRQLKPSGGSGDGMLSQQNQKNDFGDMLPSRLNAPMDVPKSPVQTTDAIQSLVQQLNNLSNTQQQHLQQHKINASNKPDVINPWGVPPTVNPVQPQIPNQWGTHSNSAAWEYRDQIALSQKMQQEEELRRRKEEEEAERKRLEEEERKRIDEQQRVERKRLEEQQRLEEEKQRKLREEQYLLQKKQQELLQKQQEEAAELARQKELTRQKELMLQRQSEQRLLEQQRQMRDEQTRLAEEQQQRLEQQRLEKERHEKEQAEIKLRQERERQEQIKMQQQFSWNSAPPPQAPAPGKSLLEIQQEEAIKQEKEAIQKKKQQAEQLRQQQQQQAQQQKAINLKWAQSAAPAAKAPIKSLTEIQAEEQAKLQKQQEKEREKRAVIQQQQNQQQAWSSQLTWADRASITSGGNGGPGLGGSGSGNGGSNKSNGGVWEREETSMATKLKSLSNNQSSNNRSQQQPPSSNVGKRQLPDDAFMKLFAVQDQDGSGSPGNKGSKQKQQQSGSPSSAAQDEFTRWCLERVRNIEGTTIDIPTFVAFLKEVESPYEVGDYARTYLGDGKDARDFSREFLERRSKWKNARKDGGGSFEDNLCRPASAVNPNTNDFQEVKAKGKKTKKGKMQKVDSRILGFSTSAATDRLNVGNRDYTED